MKIIKSDQKIQTNNIISINLTKFLLLNKHKLKIKL